MKKTKKQEQNFITENYEVFTLFTENTEIKKCTKIILGNYLIKEFENLEDAKKWIDSKPYEIYMALIGVITEILIKNKKEV